MLLILMCMWDKELLGIPLAGPWRAADLRQVFVPLQFLFLPSASLILLVFGVYMNHPRCFPEIWALMSKASKNSSNKQTSWPKPSLPTAVHLHLRRPPPPPAPSAKPWDWWQEWEWAALRWGFRIWVVDVHFNNTENTHCAGVFMWEEQEGSKICVGGKGDINCGSSQDFNGGN